MIDAEIALKLINDVGFPIASAIGCGYFVFLALKFILEGVTNAIRNLTSIVSSLDARVKAMNTDIVKIDTLVSAALNVQPDTDRIARAEREDARKD